VNQSAATRTVNTFTHGSRLGQIPRSLIVASFLMESALHAELPFGEFVQPRPPFADTPKLSDQPIDVGGPTVCHRWREEAADVVAALPLLIPRFYLFDGHGSILRVYEFSKRAQFFRRIDLRQPTLY
jgi:hypothetical protein